MALLIHSVMPRSLAAKNGIHAGDIIISINGNRVQDFIDLQFFSSDCALNFEIQSSTGESRQILIERVDGKPLGIEPESYNCRFCHNRCVFCFIDQMPPHLRPTLYTKDDDYLYSFVFGNYITLTNLRAEEFERIAKQHISPLYISVHTTDSGLRKQMMRYKQDFDVVRRLKTLSENGIEFHTQIVVVPGLNDGEALKETIRTLLHKKLNTLSIGLVPVGLTKHREKLTQLTAFDEVRAIELLDIVEELKQETERDLIFCADEFFVLAHRPIPPKEYYQEYPQLENGIGMLRLSMENFKSKKRSFLKDIKKKNQPLLFVTGKSAFSFVQEIADWVNSKFDEPIARTQAIRNDFMGELITVAGLLTYEDINKQISPRDNEVIVLPNSIFNHEGVTIDGKSQIDMKQLWQRDILVVDQLFEDWDWI
ncbi:MAG: DUF512 domain-containing protein [Candidatus Cloacimonetes bacterium HGW-Cloacimonetes-1]|jgi:putative radical SAM enzyme (TIGR03279 family)|nr:MAG: DUF512 domain-containing protein [Candidatus Cloacimonetes bacterium HGW-Cloacimonetes-1]